MKFDFEFSLMSKEDIDKVAEIEGTIAQGPWTRQMLVDSLHAGHGGLLLRKRIAENSSQEIVAYAVTMLIPPEADLLLIGVAANWQRQKLGTYLLQQICTDLQQKRMQSLFLEVRRSNVAAQALYKSLKFTEVGLRRNYYAALTEGAPLEDALVMCRQLDVLP